MNNKVLIRLYAPELDLHFDLFIPVNEFVWKIKKLIVKSISDLSSVPLDLNDQYLLMNKDNGRIYQNNEIILQTDIRNATELMLFHYC